MSQVSTRDINFGSVLTGANRVEVRCPPSSPALPPCSCQLYGVLPSLLPPPLLPAFHLSCTCRGVRSSLISPLLPLPSFSREMHTQLRPPLGRENPLLRQRGGRSTVGQTGSRTVQGGAAVGSAQGQNVRPGSWSLGNGSWRLEAGAAVISQKSFINKF